MLDSDRINRWLTLGANIGVIAGIVFLGIEVRQNNESMRAQTHAQLTMGITELLSVNINDAEYVEVLMRGNKGEDLSPVEAYQYSRYRAAWLAAWNNVAYQYEIGLYDDSEFAHHISIIRDDLESNPGIKRFYCANRDMASSLLAKAIESDKLGVFC